MPRLPRVRANPRQAPDERGGEQGLGEVDQGEPGDLPDRETAQVGGELGQCAGNGEAPPVLALPHQEGGQQHRVRRPHDGDPLGHEGEIDRELPGQQIGDADDQRGEVRSIGKEEQGMSGDGWE